MKKQHVKKRAIKGVNLLLIILLCVFSAFPFLALISTSFKPPEEIYSSDHTLLPKEPTIQGYIDILNPAMPTFNFVQWLGNSLITTGISTIVSVMVAAFGGYAMSRFRFVGRLTIGYLILVTQVIPTSLLLIPLYITMAQLNLLDSLMGIVLVYTAFNIPYCTWTMKGYIDGIPVALEEAAQIDGCTQGKAFLRVILPLCIPGLISTTLFAFIASWNEYVFASVMLRAYDKWTVSLGLTMFKGQHTTNWNGLMAGGIIITVPIVIAFWLLQRHLITGMTAGAVKQ